MEETKIFQTSEFATRDALEQEITTSVGNNIEVNSTAGHKISGTESDLKRLGLSLSTSIYGVKCEIND